MTLAGAAARGADHEVERLLADGADPRDGGDGVSPLYALARARLGEHTYDFFPYVRCLRLLLEALAERGGDAVREAILAPHGGDATVLHAAAETDWPHEATDRQFKPVFTYGWPTAPIAAAYACSSSVPPLSLSVPDGQGRTRGRWIRGSRRRERSTSPSGNAIARSFFARRSPTSRKAASWTNMPDSRRRLASARRRRRETSGASRNNRWNSVFRSESVVVGAVAWMVAERGTSSRRDISPKLSPSPRKARIASWPAREVTTTLTSPFRIT